MSGTIGVNLVSGRSSGLISAVEAAGGAWEFVSSATPSAAAAFNVLGMEVNYDYCVTWRKCATSGGGVGLEVQIVQGTTAQTSSDYAYGAQIANNSGRKAAYNGDSIVLMQTSTGGLGGLLFSGEVYLYTPKTAGQNANLTWQMGGEQDDSTHGFNIGWGEYDQDTVAVDGLSFFDTAGGNFVAQGLVSVYKRQTA